MSENEVAKELDGLMSDENKSASAWLKLKVGESVSGVLLSVSEKPAEGIYGAEIIYEIRKKDGDIVRTALKRHKRDGSDSRYYMQTRRWAPGDLVGIKFEKVIPPADGKGFPANYYETFHKPGKAEWAMDKAPAADDDF